MPAPNRRAVGASLATMLTKSKRTDDVADPRDRLVATRNRHALKWEEAASGLERRAQRADPPTSIPTRHWLGYCVRCDREVWVPSAKPRLPFCSPVCAAKYRAS